MAMTHITQSQLLRLRDALAAAFGRQGFAELLMRLERVAGDYFSDNVTRRQQALLLVKAAHEESWLPDLLRLAIVERSDNPALKAIEAELSQVTLPAGFDPFHLCCLTGDYVMVNRSRLRTVLKAMTAPDSKRILLVRDRSAKSDASAGGGTKTGKSLSMQFITAVGLHVDSYLPICIDLGRFKNALGSQLDITPHDMAKKITMLLGYEPAIVPASRRDAQWSRWSIEFCDQFEARARDDKRRPWIVIDEFNKVSLLQETLDLIKQLADRISLSLPDFRMVLIGFGDALPPQVGPHLEEEALDRSVAARDLVEFFMRAADQRRLAATDKMIASAAAESLAGLDPASDDFLVGLGRRAWEALERMRHAAAQGAPA